MYIYKYMCISKSLWDNPPPKSPLLLVCRKAWASYVFPKF